MRYRKLVGLIFLCVGAAAWPQEAPTNIGNLTCTLSGPEGPERTVSCGFKPTGTGEEGRYVGAIRGDQAAPAGKRVLVWTVVGPANSKISPALMAQRFVEQRRASGQPAALVGEKNPSIILEFETNNGSEANDAVTQIELRLISTPA